MVKFYRCEICGKIVAVVEDTKASLVCCGKEMTQLVPGTTDGVLEKHVPFVKVEKDSVKVQVGSVLHPMMEKHYIMFVALETNKGLQIKWLKSSDEPKAEFKTCEGEKPIAVYEYCNLHGLWVAEV